MRKDMKNGDNKVKLKRYKTIFVTGGSGFIGSHVVEELIRLDKRIVLFDRYKPTFKSGHIVWEKGDLKDRGRVNDAVMKHKPSLIFHIGANANGSLSVTQPEVDFDSNVFGSTNIFYAARNAKVKRVVNVSSASVYGKPQKFPMSEEHPKDPFIPYGAGKRAVEILATAYYRTWGLPVVSIRPFCVYGPGENIEATLVEPSRYASWHINYGKVPIIGDPDKKTRDFVYVDDVVQGMFILAEKGKFGEQYNAGSGTETTMRQLVEVIDNITGRKASIEANPEITEDTYRLVSSIEKLKSLGYKPQVSLEEGMKKLIQSFKDLYGDKPPLPNVPTIFSPGQTGEMK